jgi:HPt (histidine-containing phosphotransfer) domain-containing protein
MIEELKELMDDDFPVLIETYIQDCDERVTALTRAVADANSSEVRELAHAFKGSSSNLGAQKLADFCFELETMGRENNLAAAQSTFDAIKTEYQVVKDYFNTLL